MVYASSVSCAEPPRKAGLGPEALEDGLVLAQLRGLRREAVEELLLLMGGGTVERGQLEGKEGTHVRLNVLKNNPGFRPQKLV